MLGIHSVILFLAILGEGVQGVEGEGRDLVVALGAGVPREQCSQVVDRLKVILTTFNFQTSSSVTFP